ncbi:MAG: DUF4184 family protein [Candidatus Bathyarchaeia archaeon]
MALIPFHALAFMFLYFRYKRKVDPLALAVSTTFIDLETLYYLLIWEPLDHRLLHGFLLALTIYPILVAFGVYAIEHLFEERLWRTYGRLRLEPVKVRYPLGTIYLNSFLGGFSHVFLDMFTHKDMPYVIYPIAYGNPFYIGQASIFVDATVILLAIYSCFVWLRKQPPSLKCFAKMS